MALNTVVYLRDEFNLVLYMSDLELKCNCLLTACIILSICIMCQIRISHLNFALILQSLVLHQYMKLEVKVIKDLAKVLYLLT